MGQRGQQLDVLQNFVGIFQGEQLMTKPPIQIIKKGFNLY